MDELEKITRRDMERVYSRIDDPMVAVDANEALRRRQMQANFQAVFVNHPSGQAVLAELARICHFMSPALTPEDMVLHNAFKSILHWLGKWHDDREAADDMVRRILGA